MVIKEMDHLKPKRRTPKKSGQQEAGSDGRTQLQRDRPPQPSPKSHASGAPSEQNGSLTQEERWAYGLGWFGVGLGLMELAAPRRVAQIIGVSPEHHLLIRAMGLRELTSSAGIFSFRAPAAGVWSRVVGDALDLALLGAAFMSSRSHRGRLAAVTASVAGATLLDLLTAQQLSRGIETRNGAVAITASLVIDRAPEELYQRWRDFTNLPRFMKHLERIEVRDDRRSHWVAKGLAGSTVEWEAEITDDRPNERIAWRSIEGSKVNHAGSVRFEPATGNRGTFVTVDMQYRPPWGTIGAAVAAWFGEDPSQQVKMDLRRFKQVMETGEAITTEGQPAGRARARRGDTIQSREDSL